MVDATNGLNSLSCASTTLCVATDGSGNVVSTTNPTGGAGAWSTADVDGSTGLNTVACASATQICVAADYNGNIVESSSAASGAASWTTPTNIDPGPR